MRFRFGDLGRLAILCFIHRHRGLHCSLQLADASRSYFVLRTLLSRQSATISALSQRCSRVYQSQTTLAYLIRRHANSASFCEGGLDLRITHSRMHHPNPPDRYLLYISFSAPTALPYPPRPGSNSSLYSSRTCPPLFPRPYCRPSTNPSSRSVRISRSSSFVPPIYFMQSSAS
jgi:hypothetical protein